MKISHALLIVLSLNFIFFLVQISIIKIGPEIRPGGTTTIFFNPGENLIGDFDEGNYTLSDPTNRIPSDNNVIDPDTGDSWITDQWKTVKNSVLDKTGLGFLLDVVNAIPNFLKAIGVPPELAFAVGFMWHALTIVLLIMFFRGGN